MGIVRTAIIGALLSLLWSCSANAQDRAQLAVGSASLILAPDAIIATIKFGNVGRVPALGFVAQERLEVTSRLEAPERVDICATATAARGAGIVYPGGGTDHSYRRSFDKRDWPSSPMAVLHGCMAYLSDEGLDYPVQRKEEYCFLLWFERDTWRSSRCQWGNDSR